MTTAAVPPPAAPPPQDEPSLASTADPHSDVQAASDAAVSLPSSPLPQKLQQQQHGDPERALPSAGAAADQSASLPPGGGAAKKLPWWKTRWAMIGFVGAVLLVIFVVLLVLGLLGYLRKVGPFARLASSSSKGTAASNNSPLLSPSSSSVAANPLATIPLMSDPFALPPATATATATAVQTAAPVPTNPISSNNPTVDLGYATYVGTTVSGGINRFLGMRFAAAPVGDLRWRAPVSPPVSTSPQNAQSFGPICLGISVSLASGESEDCLFVNVWAPQEANTTSKLPVWLFIQGGGYVSNSNANWDGADVIRRSGNKIVFVNFNYRVALWGFLASAKVQANGALNAGLLDQRFLMQWVKNNIATFGGDPDNIIIHGASAGAGSVALHLTAYGGRNDSLFSAAIAESVFFPAQPFVPQLEYQFDRLTNATGCAAATDQIACLRGLDTAVLQAQNVPSAFPGRTASPVPLFYWTPCIDGDFLQDLPYNMFASGKFVNVPLLFGNDNNEGSGFATNAATSDDMINFLQNNYPLLSTNDTADIVDLYPLMPAEPNHAAWFPSSSMAYGEATFICPAISILSAYRVASLNTNTQLWNYRYNVQDANNLAAGLGVPHLWESFAVFGPTNLGGQTAPESYLTYDAAIVPVVMDYFLSFVQRHDPNPLRSAGAPAWADWGSTGTSNGTRLVMETNQTRMELVSGAQMERCAFWDGLAPRTQQKKKRFDNDE